MSNRRELEAKLAIDDTALDTCLVEQPGFFYHVADSVASANARRDTLKLELEELSATLDQQIRRQADLAGAKITEAAIHNQMRTIASFQELQRAYLDARTDSERWLALKEAYSQRSFMMRELVALQLAQVQNLGTERGATSARYRLGDQARRNEEEARAQRRRNSS